jgi:hypothetical protein
MGRVFFFENTTPAPLHNTENLSKNMFLCAFFSIKNVSNHFKLNFPTSNIKKRTKSFIIDLNHFIL